MLHFFNFKHCMGLKLILYDSILSFQSFTSITIIIPLPLYTHASLRTVFHFHDYFYLIESSYIYLQPITMFAPFYISCIGYWIRFILLINYHLCPFLSIALNHQFFLKYFIHIYYMCFDCKLLFLLFISQTILSKII